MCGLSKLSPLSKHLKQTNSEEECENEKSKLKSKLCMCGVYMIKETLGVGGANFDVSNNQFLHTQKLVYFGYEKKDLQGSIF